MVTIVTRGMSRIRGHSREKNRDEVTETLCGKGRSAIGRSTERIRGQSREKSPFPYDWEGRGTI